MIQLMMMKVLLRAGRNHGRWQEVATSKRHYLALLNTCFYLDSRPELRNIEDQDNATAQTINNI